MLEERGREYAFISNVDNMAGVTDLRILNKIVKERVDFALEVTKTTQADVKGRRALLRLCKYCKYDVRFHKSQNMHEAGAVSPFIFPAKETP